MGLRTRALVKLVPFVVLAAAVYGFGKSADHFRWGGATALIVGFLALALLIVVFGPITALPKIVRKRQGRNYRVKMTATPTDPTGPKSAIKVSADKRTAVTTHASRTGSAKTRARRSR